MINDINNLINKIRNGLSTTQRLKTSGLEKAQVD